MDLDHLQSYREDIAQVITKLEEMASSQPEHGQHLTFAKNHLRMAFMELGYGMALARGLNPLEHKVGEK